MKFPNETLQSYVGGQLAFEIQHDDCRFQGQIKQIELKGSNLIVKFDWVGKFEFGSQNWEKNDLLALEFEVNDEEPQKIENPVDGTKWTFKGPHGSTMTLIPKGRFCLSNKRVAGLWHWVPAAPN